MVRRFLRIVASLGVGLAGLALTTRCVGAEPISAGDAAKPAAAAGAENQELDEAAAMFRRGDVDGALKQLRAIVKKRPELPPAQMIIATWYANSSQPALARAAVEQAIAEDPADPEAYLLLADMAMRNRMMTEAGLLFGKVLEVAKATKDSGDRATAARARALAGLAAVDESRKDWKSAQQHLEALLAATPKNAGALQQLGRVLFNLKKPEEALERFREAAKLDESMLAAEATLAQLYQQSGDSKSAGKWMVDAINASPRDFKIRLAAAQWEYEIGRYDQAEEQAKAAVQLDSSAASAQMLRGTIALARKDYKTAEEYFQKVHLQSPGNAVAINNLALALVEQSEDAKKRLALEFAQLNARQYPDQGDTLATLSWIFHRLGRSEEAEASFRKTLTASVRSSPDSLYFLARYLADRGRKEDARRVLEPTVKSAGTFLMRKDAQALLEELSK